MDAPYSVFSRKEAHVKHNQSFLARLVEIIQKQWNKLFRYVSKANANFLITMITMFFVFQTLWVSNFLTFYVLFLYKEII
jgi:hypothetical protein